MRKILVIIDGLGDLPIDKFKGKTPLEYADTPNLDEISKKSKLGYMYPVNEDYAPESDTAVISILGNSADISERGEFEAVGYGLKIKRGDLVLRANFGTVENMVSRRILDRRAGRTLTTDEAAKLAEALNKNIKLPVKFEFFPTIQHRGVLVFYGGFTDNISNTDTYLHEKGEILIKDKFDWSIALDDEENSEFSANLVNSFVTQAAKILEEHPINTARKKKGLLPANIILTRDAGVELPQLNQFRTSMAIVNMPLEKGIAKVSGMEVMSFEQPNLKTHDVYKNLDESLKKTADFAVKTLKSRGEDFNFCYIHFKEIDIPGHDNKPMEKKNFIELLDAHFFKFLKDYVLENKLRLIVTADHSTPCKMKTHTSHPVPVLYYDPANHGDNKAFGEAESKHGSLGKIFGKNLLKKLDFL